MKTKKRSKLRRIFSNVINFRFWLDWERIKSFTYYLGESIHALFIPSPSTKSENFKSAMDSYHISDKDLIVKQRALFRLSLFMLFLASLIFIYSIYQFLYGTFRAGIISFIIMGIALVLAFRYHFWYFQMKQRKLGCTFREWYNSFRGVK